MNHYEKHYDATYYWYKYEVDGQTLKEWLPKVTGRPEPGDWVTLTKANGDEKEITVREVLWEFESKQYGPQAIITYDELPESVALELQSRKPPKPDAPKKKKAATPKKKKRAYSYGYKPRGRKSSMYSDG